MSDKVWIAVGVNPNDTKLGRTYGDAFVGESKPDRTEQMKLDGTEWVAYDKASLTIWNVQE